MKVKKAAALVLSLILMFAITADIAGAWESNEPFAIAEQRTVDEQRAMLQNLIQSALELLSDTRVDVPPGYNTPSNAWWAAQADHDALFAAIAAAQRVLDNTAGYRPDITIITSDASGMPVFNAELRLFVNDDRFVEQIQHGIITIPDIPVGSAVRFEIYATGKSPASRTIGNFNPAVHGTQYVILEDFRTTPMISAGNGHTLALREDGTVWAWGNNSVGQLGDGTTANRHTPVRVQGLYNIVEISAGSGGSIAAVFPHSAALRDDGTVWAWGSNEYGKLGNVQPAGQHIPIQANIENVIAVSAGNNFTVALREDGTVWAWGSNENGRLGNGSLIESLTPVQVTDHTTAYLDNVTAISAGNGHTLALRSNGTVWAWGNNVSGQLGDGSVTQRTRAIQISQGLPPVVTGIAAGNSHSMAFSGGRVWTWGHNISGQLGNGTRSATRVPFVVRDLYNVTAIAAGGNHTAVVVGNNTVMLWGRNVEGQLGINSWDDDRTSPATALFQNNVVAVAAGDNHTIALRDDGSVWAWGDNAFGQIGDNSFMVWQRMRVRVLGENARGYFMLILDDVGLSASPELLNFGTLTVGYSQPAARTVTITHVGSEEIALNALPSVAGWILTPSPGWTTPFAPSQTRMFTIHPMSGLGEGSHNTVITITGSEGAHTTIRPTFAVIPPQPPAILRHPTNVTAEEGATARFTVVTNDPGASYQWQVSTNGVTWADVILAATDTLTLSNVSPALSDNLYRVVVTNVNGTTVSNAARLTVARPFPIAIGGANPLNAGQNEWWRTNLQGSAGRRVTVAWNPPAGTSGSVQVFAGNQPFPFMTQNLAAGLLDFDTIPGVTYSVRFVVNTGSFFQIFNYRIISTDPLS